MRTFTLFSLTGLIFAFSAHAEMVIQGECRPSAPIMVNINYDRLLMVPRSYLKGARWLIEQNEQPQTLTNTVTKTVMAGTFGLTIPLDTPNAELKKASAEIELVVNDKVPKKEEMRVVKIVQAFETDREDLLSKFVDNFLGRPRTVVDGEPVSTSTAGQYVEVEKFNAATDTWEPFFFPLVAGGAYHGSTRLVNVPSYLDAADIRKIWEASESCRFALNGLDMAGRRIDHLLAGRKKEPGSMITERKTPPKFVPNGNIADIDRNGTPVSSKVGGAVSAQ